MAAKIYQDAMDDALDRLTGVGFDQVGGFPSHAPMGAEALAALGCYEQVAGWVEWNKGHRTYNDEPIPTDVIAAGDEDDWRSALGTSQRAADWTAMFEREIAEHGWRDVLATWWPRLLPGMIGGLTHGLIRTAHAVRGVAGAQPPSALQLRELAHGLGFWAAVFSPLPRDPHSAGLAGRLLSPEDVQTALSDLTSSNAGTYAASWPQHPVPLVHTITAPAAVRLVLPSVPADAHDASYRAVAQVVRTLASQFAARPLSPGAPPAEPVSGEFTPETLKAEAVSVKDEHAIKLAEAAGREYALRPDKRYLAASWVLTQRMKDFPQQDRGRGA
jgi:hypothetical protein